MAHSSLTDVFSQATVHLKFFPKVSGTPPEISLLLPLTAINLLDFRDDRANELARRHLLTQAQALPGPHRHPFGPAAACGCRTNVFG
jgi:hypothetical protein